MLRPIRASKPAPCFLGQNVLGGVFLVYYTGKTDADTISPSNLLTNGLQSSETYCREL